MTDSADDDNYDGYIPKSVDPGPSMLVATLFFCILLVALLPCFVSLGKKWKRKKAMAKLTADAHNDESESSSDDEGHPNADRPVKNKNRLRDEDGDESVSSGHSKASARTGISSVANSLFNAVLDSAPRGGPNLRPGKLALLHRDQILEAEERCEKEMCDMSYSGRSEDHDGRSIGNSVLGNGSVLGRLDHDAVSIHDAVDAPKPFFDGTHEIVNEKPNGPWYSRRQMAASYDKLLAIAEWDYESRRIFKLGFPFMVQSLLVGGAEAVRVALIGRLIGTTALSAYIVVDLVVGLTTEFMRGFQDALITLCSQALGAENNVLTGQYVQMTVIISTALYIPIFIFWYFMIKPTMSWFGLDQETVDVGQDFAILLLLSSLIHGLDESVHALLDCIGCENYSTSFASLTEVFVTVGVYLEARKETATLQGLGYVYVGVHGVALVLNVILVLWNGWIDPYLEGIIGTFSLRNTKGLRLLLSTTSSLSFGYLLTNGEWEILTFAAGFLGQAEVSAWGILGALWEALEVVTEAIGNAAEVRVGYLLGAGRPKDARLSAYKSLYLGLFATLLITSGLFIAGDDIPTWMTKDRTLQRMISDLMPLFGIGNIALSVGSMSWTLVGAQGRYRLSTAVGFAGSWLVTIPLSVLFTIILHYDLQGQTAAVVIGYMVSGTVNTYILLQSDWAFLSKRVIAYNAEHGIEYSEDDSSSSSSSSSSDDSSSSSDSEAEEDIPLDPVSIYKKSSVTSKRDDVIFEVIENEGAHDIEGSQFSCRRNSFSEEITLSTGRPSIG